jgi:hypothetical protein
MNTKSTQSDYRIESGAAPADTGLSMSKASVTPVTLR